MHSVEKNNANCNPTTSEEETDQLRRGPWTLEEDTLLIHYIARHGEGHWNLLAKRAGLKRTGKSCRLRWLNYLKPDIKRGNLTPQEQLLILELHSKWGNRWSKIAQHLPGRTDNEIKNYWRTRVQKQARQLNIESNSKRFIDAVRCFWMPRLLQKVEQSSSSSFSTTLIPSCDQNYETLSNNNNNCIDPSLSQYQVLSNSPQSSSNPQNKDSPISIHPNGCLNSFTDHQTFSFLTPQTEQHPKMCTISDPYAFENRAQNMASNNINNIPSSDFVDHFDGITINNNIINSVHYVDMLSGTSSGYEIESGLTLDPISGTEPYSFDISGLNCHAAACDWTMDDTLWNMGEM